MSNGFNGAAAARTAGYSAQSAHVQAHQLLSIPYIKDAIASRIEDIRQQAGYNRIQALDEYTANRRAALAANQIGAANAAVDGKCKLLALYPKDRAETAHTAVLTAKQRLKLAESLEPTPLGDEDALYQGD